MNEFHAAAKQSDARVVNGKLVSTTGALSERLSSRQRAGPKIDDGLCSEK
jgi:hypothetical protein